MTKQYTLQQPRPMTIVSNYMQVQAQAGEVKDQLVEFADNKHVWHPCEVSDVVNKARNLRDKYAFLNAIVSDESYEDGLEEAQGMYVNTVYFANNVAVKGEAA